MGRTRSEDHCPTDAVLVNVEAWTASSTPSSTDSTWNGKLAPSTYLHKQLDVTVQNSACRTLHLDKHGG